MEKNWERYAEVFGDGLFYPRSWHKGCAFYGMFKQMLDGSQIETQFSNQFSSLILRLRINGYDIY